MNPRLNRDAISAQGGFTLIELLVAAAGGLILMGFMAVVFGFYGRTVRENQAIIRMNDALRSASYKLRQDLQGVTCDVTPWQKPEADAGYFELIEGPLTDADAASGNTNLVADIDDVLLFTTRGNGAGFVGKMNTSSIESDAAEVAWFCVQQPDLVDGMNLYSLHRRQLLVVGYVGMSDFQQKKNTMGDGIQQNMPAIYQNYDLSLRFDMVADPGHSPNPGPILLANALSDLTKRENRFLHRYDSGRNSSMPYQIPVDQLTTNRVFPYDLNLVRLRGNPVNVSNPPWPWGSDAVLTGDRAGEDVVIRNVLAFDVRVFDPEQPAVGYVDLGNASASTRLAGTMEQRSRLAGNPTYCTWSYHYEFNGLDEDQSLGSWRVGVDQGANLVDDNSNGAVDDSLELETMPPYNVPLRGIEIRLRCYEPQGKQIRQVTVRHAF